MSGTVKYLLIIILLVAGNNSLLLIAVMTLYCDVAPHYSQVLMPDIFTVKSQTSFYTLMTIYSTLISMTCLLCVHDLKMTRYTVSK
jgi:hypothetical protein